MRWLFLALLLVPVQAYGWGVVHYQEVGGEPVVCDTTPFYEHAEHSTAFDIGETASAEYYAGITNTTGSSFDVCSMTLNLAEVGDISGETIYIELWNTTGVDLNRTLTTKVGSYGTIAGSVITSSFLDVPVTLDSVMTVENNQAVVVTLNNESGNTNYLRWTATSTTVKPGYEALAWDVSLNVVRFESTPGAARAAMYGVE